MDKKIKTLVCCSMLTVFLATFHYYINTNSKPPTDGWYQTEDNTQFYQENKPLKGFIKINDVLSYFDENGNMISDQFFTVNNHTYYADCTGYVVNGMTNINNELYLFDQEHKGYTGSFSLDKNKQLNFKDGKLLNADDYSYLLFHSADGKTYLRQIHQETKQEQDYLIPSEFEKEKLPFFDDTTIAKTNKIEIIGDSYEK